MEEITVHPQELSLIPLHHAPRQIIARGRHKIIRHKRERRDRCIYVICALIYAWLVIRYPEKEESTCIGRGATGA